MKTKPEPAVCPKCLADGVKSKIINGTQYTSCVAPYDLVPPLTIFDDDGYEHYHDESYQTKRYGYTCSKGHKFSVYVTEPCWCGWTKPTETVMNPYQ